MKLTKQYQKERAKVFTNVCIQRTDLNYLEGLKKKHRVSGSWAIIEKMIHMIKRLKLEGELKWEDTYELEVEGFGGHY